MNYFTKVKKLILDSLGYFLENIEQRYVQIKNIVNDLNSYDTDKPLSANKGNDLANRISDTNSKLGNLEGMHPDFSYPRTFTEALQNLKTHIEITTPPKSHSVPYDAYGLGSESNYGHVRISNSLPDDLVLGEAASTHSAYLLQKQITELNNKLGQKNVLWTGGDGGMLMHENQSVTLSQSLSKQRYGIVLCWSGFDPKTQKATETDWWYTFVPKWHLPGGGIHCTFTGHWNNVSKYVYIDNNIIKGHLLNDEATRTVGGITVNNNKSVLRHVWGI